MDQPETKPLDTKELLNIAYRISADGERIDALAESILEALNSPSPSPGAIGVVISLADIIKIMTARLRDIGERVELGMRSRQIVEA